MSDALAAGDGHDIVALRQYPRDRQLRGSHTFASRDLFDAVDEVEIAFEVFALEARRLAAVIGRFEVVDRLETSGEEAAADRRVGDEADAQLAHGRQNLVLGIAAPERILGLQRGDRMYRMRAPDCLRRRFGHAEVTDLAGADQIGHRADRLLDRSRAVDAVLVIQIDVIDAEALQRRVAGLADVIGLSA